MRTVKKLLLIFWGLITVLLIYYFYSFSMSEQLDKERVVSSWGVCLSQLNYDADIVFLGDSITVASRFNKQFPELNICNMGCSGDTLEDMSERASQIEYVHPERIFLMGGINSLKNNNVDESITIYKEMLNVIKNNNDTSTVYIQSVLPISQKQEKKYCKNDTIRKFNEQLKKLADEFDVTYIDLYSLYEINGYMNEEMTYDGVHLTYEAYVLWAEKIWTYVYN